MSNFWDETEDWGGSGGSSGASTGGGSFGEGAFDPIDAAWGISQQTGGISSDAATAWGIGSGAFDPGNAGSSGGRASGHGGSMGGEQEDTSFFGKLKGGISKAYDKNPLAFLQVGLGALGGAYKSEQERKLAEQQARSRIAEQNNADALRQGEVARYNGSFSVRPHAARVKKPLSRIGGTPIYNNGKV